MKLQMQEAQRSPTKINTLHSKLKTKNKEKTLKVAIGGKKDTLPTEEQG